MTCLFDCETDISWDFDFMKLYEASVGAVLDAEECPYEVTVSLLITDEDGIRTINRENRDIDSVTDVLSFPMIEYDEPSDFSKMEEDAENFEPETGELMLGDIVLCADRVSAQADEYGHDIQREFAFLIIHSMLHLCGYDHIEDKDRVLMEERQKVIIQGLYDDFPKLKV